MTKGYASGTAVDVGRSRDEIERTLLRYGATSFAYGWEAERAAFGFTVDGRQIRMTIAMPDRADFTRTETGRARTAASAFTAWEAEQKRRWRALALVIKAKLEAVASGISTVETEFAMHIVLPDGRNVGEHVLPWIADAYASGSVPALLAIPGPTNGRTPR